MLKPLDSSVLEQDQQKLRKEFTAGKFKALNVENIYILAQSTEFEYPKGSGKIYLVPQVPYREGIKLNDLFYRIMESKKYESPVQLPILERQLAEIIGIIWSLTTPKSKWKRFLKKIGWMRNPFFKNLSEGEIADLISFFLVRRMMSNVRIHYPAPLAKKTNLGG